MGLEMEVVGSILLSLGIFRFFLTCHYSLAYTYIYIPLWLGSSKEAARVLE